VATSGSAAGPGEATNYQAQARTYDLTRSASPTVARLLSKYLGPGEGRLLLDVAGGTGNYAQAMRARGFEVLIVDRSPEMLARSVPKVGAARQVVADAAVLPFRDAVADRVMLVSALHQMPEPVRLFEEARRVVRDGPYVVTGFTLENMRHAFVIEYFPGSEADTALHSPREEIERRLRAAGFSRVESEAFVYLDTADGTLPALHTDALRLAGPAYLRNTSFFHRLPERVRREGLARLAEDLRSGALEEKVKASFQEAIRSGHGTVFAAWP
jgi:SAM-dependent methyltransferase